MRPIWTGYISFGLVNIPIKLYSATNPKSVEFKLLDKKHKSPIKYKRWCEECNGEVAWEDIVKGLKIAKDEYVIFEQDELDKLKPAKSDAVDVREFVELGQIDTVYFNKNYFAAPHKAGDKAYFLFKEVLQQTAKAGIGVFVMREKEYTCAIQSYKSGILLTTLNYSYEVRDINELESIKNKPKLAERELELANQIIDRMYESDFDISKFRDTFGEKLIEAAKSGKKIEVVAKKSRHVEESLIKALEATLEQ